MRITCSYHFKASIDKRQLKFKRHFSQHYCSRSGRENGKWGEIRRNSLEHQCAHFLGGIIDKHPGFDIIVAVIEGFLETGVTNAESVILAELTKKIVSNENSICPNISYYKTKIATLELQLNSEMGTPSVTIQTI